MSPEHFHPVLQKDMCTLQTGHTFLVERPAGCYPLAACDGLYHYNCRMIAQSSLTINGESFEFLDNFVEPSTRTHRCSYTNREGWKIDDSAFSSGVLYLRRKKAVLARGLEETLHFSNFGQRGVRLRILLTNVPDFADMFEVRNWLEDIPRHIHTEHHDESFVWKYEGRDGISRSVEAIAENDGVFDQLGSCQWTVDLEPNSSETIRVVYHFRVGGKGATSDPLPEANFKSGIQSHHYAVQEWFSRSAEDLEMLCVQEGEESFPYAGLPWFSAIFGRDALWTGLESCWLWPSLSRGILKNLADSQARDFAPLKEAEVGKIVHEMRWSERTNTEELPFGAYYGSVDATSLYIILAHRYWERTGDRETLEFLLPAIQRAAQWCMADRQDYLYYENRNELGLVHQGWRDADDAYFDAQGCPVEGKLALVEAQAYRIKALTAWYALSRDLRFEGGPDPELLTFIEHLKQRFFAAFWDPKNEFYFPALNHSEKPLPFFCSSAGHVLWAELVPAHLSSDVVEQLFRAPFWSGWGVRTVPEGVFAFNPLSYHNGGVWPHDTAICSIGAAHYGLKEPALRCFDSLLAVAEADELFRLPELFSGFTRLSRQERPLRFATACSPQAWACVVPFGLLRSLLGLDINALSKTITFRKPCLPNNLKRLKLLALPTSDGEVSLELVRVGETVSVTRVDSQSDYEIIIIS